MELLDVPVDASNVKTPHGKFMHFPRRQGSAHTKLVVRVRAAKVSTKFQRMRTALNTACHRMSKRLRLLLFRKSSFKTTLLEPPERRPGSWETPLARSMLDDIWRDLHAARRERDFSRVIEIVQDTLRIPEVGLHDIQDFCAIVKDYPENIVAYASMLHPPQKLELCEGFSGNGLFKVTLSDGAPAIFCAAFGFGGNDIPESHDEQILTLLRDVLVNKEHENAVITLRDKDASRTLELMQQLLDRSTLWVNFATDGLREHDVVFDDMKYKRLRRLQAKLAAISHELPASIWAEITNIDETYVAGGTFGDVYRATYRGSPVALKRMKLLGPGNDKAHRTLERVAAVYTFKSLLNEILLWRQLSHPNIMPLIGVQRASSEAEIASFSSIPTYSIVMPWMFNGTIRHYLEQLDMNQIPAPLPLWIANALQYLHDQGVVHGDLRGANIMIDEGQAVRLTDFGLSILVKTRVTTLANTYPYGGTPQWMAPELHRAVNSSNDFESYDLVPDGPPSAVDIYAFGITCVELFSREDPKFRDDGIVHFNPTVVLAGGRPKRPVRSGNSIPDPLWALIEQCWAEDAEERPAATQVAESLKVIFPADIDDESSPTYAHSSS
ncbi:hypothetical protein NM688_g1090 [Phlebia brevispora]|uniref:Uncharacterized protein n=1 Tax=Phlebia brevispora TaxID=194682 RepID=A0ACC1TCS6_9APHY|nr:hypothetical protein NM688_g1090 [Phlebia brevispora]